MKRIQVVLFGLFLLGMYSVVSVFGQTFPKVPFDRYQLHSEMTETLKTWTKLYPDLTKLHAIGESYQGKTLWVLEITNFKTGPGEDKPGFWADGGTHPDEPVGTPMVMHDAQVLLLGYGKDPFITNLLDTRVIYIMPKVNPDGTDYYLTEPGMISHAKPYDSDRDGLVDEDPVEDLNGDGAITVMRIRDETGPLKVSPLDSRLLTVREDGEKGQYRTITEGIDNDGDGRFNEDGIGGINVNRNYPFNWNPSQSGSGAHPLSIPESRSVVEFISARPNITGAYSIHGGGWQIDFLLRPPTNMPDESLPDFDFYVYKHMTDKFQEITDGDLVEGLYYDTIMGNRRKPGPYGYGLFMSWAYRHLGIYAFSPEMCGVDADYNQDGEVSEIEFLQWNDKEKGGKYYIDWKPFDHPQLGRVEIGGWVKKIAPIDAGLERICKKYTEFNLYQASLSPLLRIHRVSQKDLSSDIVKVESEIANVGFLPTYISKVARQIRRDDPIIVTVECTNCEILSGSKRIVLGHLEGNAPQSPGYFLFSGGSAELPSKTVNWIVKKTGSNPSITVTASCPKAGKVKERIPVQ